MRRDDLSIGGGAAALDLSHHLHPFADMKVMREAGVRVMARGEGVQIGRAHV